MNVTVIAAIYGIGFLPVLVAGIGLWPLRWWQAALVLLGPAITTLALIDGSPLQALGWLPVYGIPWAVHLIAPWPMLFTARLWARIAVPLTVIGFQVIIAVVGSSWILLVYFALPLISAGFALLLAWGGHLDDRDRDRTRTTT